MPPQMMQQPINVDTSSLENLLCPACKASNMFYPVQQFKILPRIHPSNPTGQDIQIALTLIQCIGCGTSFDGPQVLIQEEKSSILDSKGNISKGVKKP